MLALLATAIAMASLTWLLGWWGIVIAALVAGTLLRRRGAPWLVALSAIVAWGALLAVDSFGGRFAALATSIAGVMRVPVPALLIVTLLFGALLAWSAAVVGDEIGRRVRSTPPSA
ncbi:MAG: hypothetical protein DMD35_03670 [Gemmatimonadetes bacterium]|nr:MAG: hypothetical protein DMD35_03670 [Gemmatimonadota bacterium]